MSSVGLTAPPSTQPHPLSTGGNTAGTWGLRDSVAVYFPHSHNFSGELFIVPRARLRVVDIAAQEAMKFIVSGGLIHLREHRERSGPPG